MKKIGLLLLAMVAFLVMISLMAGEEGVEAAKGKKTSASCAGCHSDFFRVLPKGHPVMQGGDIKTCIGCHVPDMTGKAAPNAFSARLHRTHQGPKSKVDFTICHTWVPGKSLGLLGQKGLWGKPTKEDMAVMKKMFASWADSSYLDSLHAKKNVTCIGCHGKELAKEGDTVENSRCLTCHGPAEKLFAKTAPKDFPDRNPHKSHLGDIACTVCHHAHGASKVYCLECHKTFKMKIQGEAK